MSNKVLIKLIRNPFCKCGCGKLVTKNKKSPYDWNNFIVGHNSRGYKHSIKTREKMSVPKTEKTKRKMSIALTALWQDPKYQESQLKAIFAGCETSPNKPERRLRRILNKLFPKEYKFVGDGKTFIGGKCPDFININGQKKLIELFGNYWHSKIRTGLKKKIHRQQRQAHFERYGFSTCVIWEKELQDISKLKKKLRRFHSDQR